MTSLMHYLEDFGSDGIAVSHPTYTDETLENERLESFDKGYRAGWDDAIKAKADDSASLSNTFAQNLQDLSFTYHEVHSQILANLGPLFDEILEKMLPTLARDTLGAHVSDQLSKLARDLGTVTIEIVVAPGSGEQVSQLVSDAESRLPIKVRESDSVQEGQAEMKLGAKEIAVDLKSVSDQIAQAVHAVLFKPTEERAHA